MAFSGGTFSLLTASSAYQTGQTADGAALYQELAGIAAGLSACLLKDGSQSPTADLTLAGYRLTNLGNASASTDAVNRQTADGRYARLSGFTMAGAALGDGNAASGFVTGDLAEVTASTLATSAAHLGKWVNITHGTGCTVTLHDLPGEGAEIGFIQRGAGAITFAVASGTLRTRGSLNKSGGQYAGVVAIHRDGEWHLFGDRTS